MTKIGGDFEYALVLVHDIHESIDKFQAEIANLTKHIMPSDSQTLISLPIKRYHTGIFQ